MPNNLYLTPAFLEDNLAQGVKPDTLADFIGANVPAFRTELNTVKLRSNNDPRAIEAFLLYKAYGTTRPENRTAPLSAPQNTYDPAEHEMGALRSTAQGIYDAVNAPGDLLTGAITTGISKAPLGGLSKAAANAPETQQLGENAEKTVNNLGLYGGAVGSAFGPLGTGAGTAVGEGAKNFVHEVTGQRDPNDPMTTVEDIVQPVTTGAVAGALDYALAKAPSTIAKTFAKQKIPTGAGDALAKEALRFQSADDFVKAAKEGSLRISLDDIEIPKAAQGPMAENPASFAAKYPEPAAFADQPIDVRFPGEGGKIKIVDGIHRYFKAVREGKPYIQAKLFDTSDDQLRSFYEAAIPDEATQRLVQPKTTERLIQETAQKSPELVQKGGLIRKGKILPSAEEKAIAQQVSKVEGVRPRGNIVKNMKAVSDGIEQTADTLTARLESNNAVVSGKELAASLRRAKERDLAAFGNEQTAEHAYQGILNIWNKVKSSYDSNLLGLWKARKAFDAELERQFGKRVFDPTMEKPLYAAVRSVRQTINEAVEKGANGAGTTFLPEIRHMSSLYDALENMSTKVGKDTLNSGVGKALNTRLGKITTSAAVGGAAAALGYGTLRQ